MLSTATTKLTLLWAALFSFHQRWISSVIRLARD
jgi:hypothetical protein